MRKLKHLDLFSGIMGFSLGLEATGKYKTVGFCEIEPFCQALIKEKKPSIPIWRDIVKLNDYLERALISLPADSRARTSARRAKALGYNLTNPPARPLPVRDCSGSLLEPFAWYDRQERCWRTWQSCLIGGWALYSGSWPRSGMTRNGIAFRRADLARPTSEIGAGLWPTPCARDWKDCGSPSESRRNSPSLASRLLLPTPRASRGYTGYGGTGFAPSLTESITGQRGPANNGLKPNTSFVEWMMGYPTGWGVLQDAETQLRLRSLKLLAKRLQPISKKTENK